MAQNKYTLSAAWLPVATGAGNATFEFEDHPGEWTVLSSISPAEIVGGVRAESGKREAVTLAAGQYLHLRGRGVAYLIADTLV
jgi:hypothetical protein